MNLTSIFFVFCWNLFSTNKTKQIKVYGICASATSAGDLFGIVFCENLIPCSTSAMAMFVTNPTIGDVGVQKQGRGHPTKIMPDWTLCVQTATSRWFFVFGPQETYPNKILRRYVMTAWMSVRGKVFFSKHRFKVGQFPSASNSSIMELLILELLVNPGFLWFPSGFPVV